MSTIDLLPQTPQAGHKTERHRRAPVVPAPKPVEETPKTFREALDRPASTRDADRRTASPAGRQEPEARPQPSASEEASASTNDDSVVAADTKAVPTDGDVTTADDAAAEVVEVPADEAGGVSVTLYDDPTDDSPFPLLQIQFAPAQPIDAEGVADAGTLATTEPIQLPAWLNPFDPQSGLLTISLNTEPIFNGLIAGTPAPGNGSPPLTAPAVPGLPAGDASVDAQVLPVTPVLGGSDTGAQSDASTGGETGPGQSGFASNTSNSLNSAAATASAFTLPASAEPAPTVNPLLNADLTAAPRTTPGGANPGLSATLNPAGVAESENGSDALNAARLNRGLNSVLNQKGGNVTLRLTPPEMGTVRINLNMQGANVSAQFHAETESARTLLTQQLSQLRTSLEAQGLNVERLGVQALNNTANSSGLQQQDEQSQAEADGRSRGQQQQGGSSQSSGGEAEEERARENLAAARDLFTDLLEEDPDAA